MADKYGMPVSSLCLKALADKQNDKRRTAALEIERTVKDLNQRGEKDQIQRIVKLLAKEFVLSQNSHARKGGLVALASCAVALGKDSAFYIEDFVQPVISCFSDADQNVRYFACQSLYNVVKVARSAVLPYFTEIFNGVSRLAADPEQQVKNGSELLDRAMKEIVTESSSFDLVGFIPILREKMMTKNEFARQFIISWISVLDTVPDIKMVVFLPDLLDGLFMILEDPKIEIKAMCATLFQEFLRSIKQDPSQADFTAMNNIVIVHCHSSDDMVQLTALTWIKEFIELSGRKILPFTSGILTAVLPCLAYETDLKQNIKEIAKSVNYSLMQLVSSVDDVINVEDPQLDLHSMNQVLLKFLTHTKVPTKVAVLRWIYHLFTNVPNRMSDQVDKLMMELLRVLSDPADDVVQQALQVIAQIVTTPKNPGSQTLPEFINNLVRLFNADRRLLDDRGSVIIRQLCTLLDSKDVYLAFSAVIQEEKNLAFASTMVDYLNTILLTSSELFELRSQLKELADPESRSLFNSLYNSWAHNPVATLALCLLSQNYSHACDLINIFGSLEVTVEFLSEIDKLVQLIESPIFAYLRLDLIEVQNNSQLVQVLYGLLMLLPQTEAFHALRHRLNCIPHFYLPPPHDAAKSKLVEGIDFEQLLKHFISIQEQHRKEKLEARAMSLLEKGIMNV